MNISSCLSIYCALSELNSTYGRFSPLAAQQTNRIPWLRNNTHTQQLQLSFKPISKHRADERSPENLRIETHLTRAKEIQTPGQLGRVRSGTSCSFSSARGNAEKERERERGGGEQDKLEDSEWVRERGSGREGERERVMIYTWFHAGAST